MPTLPRADDRPDDGLAAGLIPGAYERNTLTHRQPGSMGGSAFGTDGIPPGPSTMSAATTAQRQREGGALRQRPRWWQRLW